MNELDGILEKEDNLKQIRKLFFPIMDEDIITGYNLYTQKVEFPKINFFLSYLHSDLTNRHKHFKELTKLLEKEGFLKPILIINDALVNLNLSVERYATYVTIPHWKDPKKTRYFTFNGKELGYKEAKKLNIELIGENKQYDMHIKIENDEQFRELVNIFKKHVSKYQLDYYGRIKVDQFDDPIENKNAIYNSWEIPLITITKEKKPNKSQDFLTINKFDTNYQLNSLDRVIINSLVRAKTKRFKEVLTRKGLDYDVSKRFALRTFIERYVDR